MDLGVKPTAQLRPKVRPHPEQWCNVRGEVTWRQSATSKPLDSRAPRIVSVSRPKK